MSRRRGVAQVGGSCGGAVERRLRAMGAAIVNEGDSTVTEQQLRRGVRGSSINLPVVDLSSADAKAQLADACTRVGFQMVVNHGVEADAHAAVVASEEFFRNASASDIDLLRAPGLGYRPGFQHAGHLSSETYRTEHGHYRVRRREDFVVVHPEAAKRKAAGDPYHNARAAACWYGDCANRFPTDGVWRAALEQYYYRMEALSQLLLGLCGEILAGDSRHFSRVSERHTTNLSVAFHEEQQESTVGASVAEHSDSALFTLIKYGSFGVQGLQLQEQDTGDWYSVSNSDLPPGALVLNIGDALRHLSHGAFLSTPHRVVDTPPSRNVGSEMGRLALCYFFAPAYDVPLVPVGEKLSCNDGDVEVPSQLGGLWTHNYRVAPTEERESFDRWRTSLR
jgi:isopenicillin N synthase-like dioxygenase